MTVSWSVVRFSWRGFPNGSDSKKSACNSGDMGSIPGVGKISWRREWQLTLEFLPEESHEQRILVSHSLWGGKQSDTTELPTTSLSMSKGKNKFWKKSN